MKKFCKDCKFWERSKFRETDLEEDEHDHGKCKRYPPNLTRFGLDTEFPKTKALEKECGEFKDKTFFID